MALTKVSYSMIEGAPANVLDYGAVGNGIANDSNAVQAAINTGRRVRFPAGTYLINVTIANKTILEGDGSTATIVKPYDPAIAAMTYTQVGGDWSYHSEVRNIGFTGIGTKTGVGFTFGQTVPANYVANNEMANNVKFYGCRFVNLNKGVQFPFGNIGTEFYSCGWDGNKYGVYTMNNKFGAPMHAGNKYFYAGEFSNNECAFYCNDDQTGFGGITFHNTIIERNLIGVYIYSNQQTYCPIKFDNVWFESNGQISTGAATVTIDAWSGSTRTDQTLTKRTIILDGDGAKYQFNGCGIFTDVHVKGENTYVFANECRVEVNAGFDGHPSTVDYPSSSFIRLNSSYTDGGFFNGASQINCGSPTAVRTLIGTNAIRWFITEQRSSKVASFGPSRAMSSALTSAATTTGSFNLTGTVVSDGRIYASCNEFTRNAFASNEFTYINSPNTSITTSAGWYVFTLDFKDVVGDTSIYVWNRGSVELASQVRAATSGQWYTVAAIGYSPGSQQLFLDFSGSNQNCTWRVSAYQIHRFDTLQQAQSFLESGAFAES